MATTPTLNQKCLQGMGRWLWLLAASGAVTALGIGSGTGEARAGCRPAGTQVIKRSSLVTVYKKGEQVYACTRSRRTARRLLDAPARRVHIAGRYVGYLRGGECEDCWRLVVINVATGHTRMSDTSALYPGDPFGAFAIDASGRAAWVFVHGVTPAHGPALELHVMDADGEEPVDSGAGLAQSVPVIRGSTVRWSRDGRGHAYRFRRRPCGLQNSRTLERNALARVYRAADAIWGCVLGSERRTRLGPVKLIEWDYKARYWTGDALLAGHFASINEGYPTLEGGVADLAVVDLASGQVVTRWTANDVFVENVVLAPAGAIAWVNFTPSLQTHEVRKSDADGEAIVLDTGKRDEIDPASFRLGPDGTTLSWTHTGEQRVAALRAR
jgi:hypothetical protein